MSYQKTEDLLELAVWMQSTREGVSISDIMERFNVSRRTAERMRDMILNHFIQAEEAPSEDRKKRWRIPQGTLKDMFQFSANDMAVLNLAQEALKKENLYIELEKMKLIIEKIKAAIKPDTFRRIEPDSEILLEAQGFAHRPGPRIKIDPKIIETIKNAMLASHKIEIKYQNANGNENVQILNPYGFLYGNKHYLVAYSDYFKDYRYYVLYGIKSIKLLDEYFVRDEKFSLQDYVKDCFGVYREKPFDVEWLFDKNSAKDAENYVFHPSQKMTKNPDGTLTVKFHAGGKQEMDWHLYTWGNSVKVIKPQK